ncbi:MAG: 2-hydroxyacyl-CoA dehydratase family protein [Dehalococcoidia bacterium]|jgi:benzoyl-CoA reductase/2-hydroxyglutaryl-CoA dehydratase subunit BcrC/BadD/HgdB
MSEQQQSQAQPQLNDYVMALMEKVSALSKSDDPYDKVQLEYYQLSQARTARVRQAISEGTPTASVGGNCVPELCLALDMEVFQALEFPLYDAMMNGGLDGLHKMIDASAEMFGNNMCTFIRLAGVAMEKNLCPKGTVLIGMSSICEAGSALAQLVTVNPYFKGVPNVSIESPGRRDNVPDDEALEYLGEQLKNDVVPFLEKYSGKKLDMDKLKHICKESNEQLHLWWEYNELRRNIPCPSDWEVANFVNAVARYWGLGHPECKAWLQRLVNVLEQRVKEHKGITGINEKIRVFWFDFPPIVWGNKVWPWLGKEFGAVMVMDLYSDNPPHTYINTSDEKQMWKDLARRSSYDFGMPRIALGTGSMYAKDTVRVIKDFSCNAVIWPGHMGHKDAGALVNIVQEQCRNLKVPFLNLGCDLADDRYTSPDAIKDKIANFFQVSGLV